MVPWRPWTSRRWTISWPLVGTKAVLVSQAPGVAGHRGWCPTGGNSPVRGPWPAGSQGRLDALGADSVGLGLGLSPLGLAALSCRHPYQYFRLGVYVRGSSRRGLGWRCCSHGSATWRHQDLLSQVVGSRHGWCRSGTSYAANGHRHRTGVPPDGDGHRRCKLRRYLLQTWWAVTKWLELVVDACWYTVKKNL